jgi:hypothetical protein
MLSIKYRDRNIHEVPLALVVGRVALFTITITSTKVYTKNGSNKLHTTYTNKQKYICMHAKMLSDDF